MRISRRHFVHAAAGAAALPAVSSLVSSPARADDYPAHPVRLIVGFAAGSTTDILGRLMGQWLSQNLDQPFIIENRPGAGGNIGALTLVNADPDGYTLLMVPPAVAANAALYPQLTFDFIRDTVPVAGVVRVPNVLEVDPSVPVKTVPEFIAYAKTQPLSYASAGVGTASHLAGELFNRMTGLHLQHVPYRGDGPAMADLIANHVQVGFATMTASIGHIRAGKLRPLGVTTVQTSGALPGIPSVSQFVPGYEASSWFGISAPKGTPAPIVDKLNQTINAGLADATIKSRIADMGGMLLNGSPADFGKLIAAETAKWGKVIRDAGIKAE
jgi:tripartite-type tricarboxylate transporter receptor subunit TctC